MVHEYFFEHHRVEAKRNRFRLRMALLVICAVGVLAPAAIMGAQVQTNTVVDGVIIFDRDDDSPKTIVHGAPESVEVSARRVSTDKAVSKRGESFSFPGLPAAEEGDHYKMQIHPQTIGDSSVKGVTWCVDECVGYDPKTSNFRSGAVVDFIFSARHTYHMSWIYESSATVAVGRDATQTTARGSSATSSAAEKPVPAQVLSAVTASPNPDQADKIPPSPPGNLQAITSGSNALVQLSWSAADDSSGIKSYNLERSLDKTSWTVIGASISGLNFTDDTVAFGVVYYYRLSATDVAGNTSDYATIEARTGDFSANSTSSDPGTYASSDSVAVVDVPEGTFQENALCTVENTSGGQFASPDRAVVAGPYSLVCKNIVGEVLHDYSRPVDWSYALKSKLKGSPKLVVVSQDRSGEIADVTTAIVDASTHTMRFKQASATATVVMAIVERRNGPSSTIIVIIATLALLVAGVVVMVLRKSQSQKYIEYLRSKYYDL